MRSRWRRIIEMTLLDAYVGLLFWCFVAVLFIRGVDAICRILGTL